MVVVSDQEFIQELTAENQRLARRLEMLENKLECHWFLDMGDSCEAAWNTSCNNAFQFEDGTPEQNHFVFCPYCGNRIVAEIVLGNEEEEACDVAEG